MTDVHVSRRDFARHAALATGGLLVGTAGTTRGEEAPRVEPMPQQAPEPDGLLPRPEIEDFYMMALLQEFPSDHLTDEQLGAIRAGITFDRLRAGRMRRYPLDNGDEPATVFRAREA